MRKTPLSSTTVTVDQFCVAKRRLFAEIRPTRRMDTTRPATTAATRPDPPRCSAGMEARKGMAKEKTVSEVGSFRRARTRTPSSPTAQPTPIATTSAIRKAEARAPGLSAFSLAATPALVAAARRTRAVASLNSPSPSSTVMIRWATPLRLAIEPEVHGRHPHRGGEQQRGQDHLQNDVGVDPDGGDHGQETDRQAHAEQDQRRRHSDAGRGELAGDDDEHSDEDDGQRFHPSSVVGRPSPAVRAPRLRTPPPGRGNQVSGRAP